MSQSIFSEVQAWLSRKQAALLPQGSLRARFVIGILWTLTGTSISQGLQLAATIFVARWLGKADFGAIGAVKSTVGMFGVFVGLGLGLTATKYVSELREKHPQRAGGVASLTMTVALASGSIITVILVLLAPWLASHTLASPAVARPLEIGAGLLFFGEVNGVQAGILSGLEAFGSLARVSLLGGLCAFPIIITCTLLGGLNGAVTGMVVSLALTCVLTHLTLRRAAARAGIPFSHLGGFEERPILWKFTLPAFLSGAVVTPAVWACNALLVNRPKGYAELGLFSAADQWRNVVIFLPGIIARVVLPILSSQSDQSVEEASQFSNTLEAGFSVGVLVAFPLVTILSFGSSLIMRFYGPDYGGMRYPLAGLLYTAGVMAIGQPIGLAVQAKGAMWLGFIFNFTWGLCLLGSFRYLLLGSGAWGLALAYASSYLALTIVFGWYFCKEGFLSWRLGVRTYLACLSLLLFAFVPLDLPARLRLGLSPVALGLSLVAVWAFLPANVSRRLLQTLSWVSRRRAS